MLQYFVALLAFAFVQITVAEDTSKRVVCYFDSDNYLRSGAENFTQFDLEHALPLCTHLVYSYAGITRGSKRFYMLNDRRKKLHYYDITVMKVEYPHLKIYLSLGGDRDQDKIDAQKYSHFMQHNKKPFTRYSVKFLKEHHFDGLDLAFQFPHNETTMNKTEAQSIKQNFTAFVQELHEAFAKEKLSLSLTVLPNVNSTHFLDIPKISDKFEYINLFAFDFSTPERSPNEADYTAPIYFKDNKNRLPHKNVDFQVNYWIENGCPADKLNLGIPTFARTWKTTNASALTILPVISNAAGPGMAGIHTKTEGLLSLTEVCAKPNACINVLELNHGSYSICPIDNEGIQYMWMGYDGLEIAAAKAKYANKKGLGGVAIVDLTYDDFRGECTDVKYPILHSIKKQL